jgi:hypothetical protein
LKNNTVINLVVTPRINVRADVRGIPVNNVKFSYDGAFFRTEITAPFAFNGNDKNDFFPFVPLVGCHNITATTYSRRSLTGRISVRGVTIFVSFCVTKPSTQPGT